MNKTGKRWICFLALLMCLCLLLTSCAPAPQQPAGNSEAQVENLAKLCKVWGYVKYTHPVFLLGEKDWDEELLKLIPAVSKADSDEVNGILHEWVDSLGEVDYGTLNRVPLWAAAKEEEISVQADTSWISADYLGEELTQQLSFPTSRPVWIWITAKNPSGCWDSFACGMQSNTIPLTST